MRHNGDLLIFTDMDGSLLCHDSYSHEAANATLLKLQEMGIAVIPTTSKTKAELLHLRAALNNAHPFIAENGAAVFIPVDYFEQQPLDTEHMGDFWVKKFVDERHYWQSLISRISSVDADKFTIFAKLTTVQISELTGLNEDDALRASYRHYSEPIVWKGNDDEKELFISELKIMGANVLQGGRFLHVSGQCDKGLALTWLSSVYEIQQDQCKFKTVAIGDSHNDIAMLETADIALLVRSPAHKLPDVHREANTYISPGFAPKGWAEGVETILQKHHSYL
jgi:mannosyl-3-phosphoglycerate phosphatase family protein